MLFSYFFQNSKFLLFIITFIFPLIIFNLRLEISYKKNSYYVKSTFMMIKEWKKIIINLNYQIKKIWQIRDEVSKKLQKNLNPELKNKSGDYFITQLILYVM